MPVIKRYPNRKLYDMEAKQYITLEGIAELIRQGKEIHVIDNASGEDLTPLVLTQVISELEKKQRGFLPRNILAGLIQAGGDRLSTLQRNLMSTVGFWTHVDEEIRRRVLALVKQGELAETEGQSLLEKLLSIGQPASEAELFIDKRDLEHKVEKALAEKDIPTRADLELVLKQLETLADKLDDLDQPGQK